MPRHLGQALALEGHLLRGLQHRGVGEDVAGDDLPVAGRAHLELGLDPADARAVEILPLPARGPHRAIGQAVGQGHVGDEILHLVPEGGGAAGEWPPALLHADLAAGEPLRLQVLVGHRHVVAHAEDAVQLVDRRHPEALIGGGAHVGGGRGVHERGDARAHADPVDVRVGLAGGDAGGRRGVAPEAVVGAPVVAADARDQLEHGDGPVDVLHEEPVDLLLAARHPRAGEVARHVDPLVGLPVDPPEVGAREQPVVPERAGSTTARRPPTCSAPAGRARGSPSSGRRPGWRRCCGRPGSRRRRCRSTRCRRRCARAPRSRTSPSRCC